MCQQGFQTIPNTNSSLQSIVDADNNNVLIRSGVDILGTINLVASYTPGWEGGGEIVSGLGLQASSSMGNGLLVYSPPPCIRYIRTACG